MGWKASDQPSSEVACTGIPSGSCGFLGPPCGLAVIQGLELPLILSRRKRTLQTLNPFPWIQHLDPLGMNLEGKLACLVFQLLLPLAHSCGSCTSGHHDLLVLFPLLLINMSQVSPCERYQRCRRGQT